MDRQQKMRVLSDLRIRLDNGAKVNCLVSFPKSGTAEKRKLTKELYDEFEANPDMDVYPYLRRMTDMTREEREEYSKLPSPDYPFLTSHNFDFRDLIRTGLAMPTK